jgi:hypothetical protein
VKKLHNHVSSLRPSPAPIAAFSPSRARRAKTSRRYPARTKQQSSLCIISPVQVAVPEHRQTLLRGEPSQLTSIRLDCRPVLASGDHFDQPLSAFKLPVLLSQSLFVNSAQSTSTAFSAHQSVVCGHRLLQALLWMPYCVLTIKFAVVCTEFAA